MRNGRILAEETPDNIMKRFQMQVRLIFSLLEQMYRQSYCAIILPLASALAMLAWTKC